MINDGSNTVANVGYICPDATIFAGFSGGRPFYVAAKDIDGGSGVVWGYTSTNGYPLSTTDGGAVFMCKNMGNGWFLPNTDQLNEIYHTRRKTQSFRAGI